MQQQQVCAIPSSSANSVNLKSPSGPAVALVISRWHIPPQTHPTPSILIKYHELLRLHEPNVNSPEGRESASPPRCCSVRLHAGNSRLPTTAGDGDDKAKQTYSRGTAAKPNRVMKRSWAYTCRHTPPSLPVSSSHIEAQFVWADWKVLSC